jgi:subtilisin family serine protease
VKGEAIVKFRRSPTRSDLEIAAVSVEALSWKPLPLNNVYMAELNDDTTVPEAVAKLSARSDVEYAEPNYIYRAAATPNDSEFPNLWGLNNAGQTIEGVAGTPDADIDAPEAWDVTKGSPNVVVAVIDSGVAYGHPDLNDNIWINPGEIPGNGVDDDGNGFVDDVRGWDFVQDDNQPLDYNEHGTHVAGTIGAEGNNAQGVTGVNWDVSIMPVRGLDANGSGDAANLAAGIKYACDNGAQITNNSWGGSAASFVIFDAFADCPDVLHVVAAGNSGLNLNGGNSSFPCEYDGPDSPFGALSNILCVASSTNTDVLSSFSNRGTESVHLAAPGSSVRSTVPVWGAPFVTEDFDPTLLGWTAAATSGTLWGRETAPNIPAGNGSAADSPGGNYQNNTNSWLERDAALNLTGRAGCRVDLLLRLASELNSDGLLVETSTDGGATWDIGGGFSGSTGGDFDPVSSDLSAADGASSALFRFRFVSDGSVVFDGAYISNAEFSCLDPGGQGYAFFNGTSMATPHVSGVAALVLARNPSLSTGSVKSILLSSVDPKPAFGDTITGGRLNAATALALTPPPPQQPPPPQPQPPPAPQPAPPPPPPPPPVVKCKVPNVKGKTVGQARTALKAKHCKLGAVKSAFNAKMRKGRVFSQTRRPGATLPRNTAVGVKISKGARKK